MQFRKVLAAVVTVALVVGILFAISYINDKIRLKEDPGFTFASEENTSEEKDWWTEKENAAKEEIAAFKAQLLVLIETDKFTSDEAKELVEGLANAPLDAKRDNFHLSEEEWKYILDFEDKIGYSGEGEVKLSDHLIFYSEMQVFQMMYIEIVDDSGEGIDYWYLSWD